MMEPEVAAGPVDAQAVPELQGETHPRRQDHRDEYPILIEVAWLVIETATAIARLRGILARIKGGPR